MFYLTINVPESFLKHLTWASSNCTDFHPRPGCIVLSKILLHELSTSIQLMGVVVYKPVSGGVVKGMLADKCHLRCTFHALRINHFALKVLDLNEIQNILN